MLRGFFFAGRLPVGDWQAMKLTGYGKLRAAARRPRTFPHPLEIPAPAAAPPGFPQLHTAAAASPFCINFRKDAD
jgi:hypothetical protein